VAEGQTIEDKRVNNVISMQGDRLMQADDPENDEEIAKV